MSLSDYSSFEQEIKDAPEPQILPAGTEVKFRIVRVDSGIIEKEDSKSYGAKYYNPLFDVPAEPLCPMFNDFFYELADKDKIPPDQFAKALPKFRAFAEAIGLDYSRPFDWETDLDGMEGWAVLGIQKDKDGQYPDKNVIRKYIVPK